MLLETLHQLNPVTHISDAIHASTWGKGKKTITQGQYDDLVYYYKYATTTHSPTLLTANGAPVIYKLFDPLTDTNGYICRDDKRKEIVLAMRGIMAPTSLAVDSSAPMVPIKAPTAPGPAHVHGPFQTAWSSVEAPALAKIREQLNLYPDYNIIAVGHSSGGAIASLAAVAIKGAYPAKALKLYTYGQPRTGNAQYAQLANTLIGVDKIFRVVHGTDGVPTAMPTNLGYCHHGTEYWVLDPPSPNRTFICNGAGTDKEDPEGSAQLPSGGFNVAHTAYFGIELVATFS